MKNVIITEILSIIEDSFKKTEINPNRSDFIIKVIQSIEYGNISFYCSNLSLDSKNNYGYIKLCKKNYEYDELMRIHAKSHMIWLWTKKDSVEYFENRLFSIITNAIKNQGVRKEKMKEEELFNLLPEERKQQIKREKKLERLTK